MLASVAQQNERNALVSPSLSQAFCGTCFHCKSAQYQVCIAVSIGIDPFAVNGSGVALSPPFAKEAVNG
jgi:hypothetical protein